MTDKVCKICGEPVVFAFRKYLKTTQERVDMPPFDFKKWVWGPQDEHGVYWDYYRCAGVCGAVMSYNMDDFSPQQMAAFYTYSKCGWLFRTHREDRCLTWTEKHFGKVPGNSLLLFGPGRGPSIGHFKKKGYKVTSCDFGPGHDLSPGQLDPKKHKFGACLISEVLEHLRDPAAEVGKILDCLVPGGYLVGSTGIWSRVPRKDREAGTWWYTDHHSEGHILFWTANAFDLMAHRHGCFAVLHPLAPKLHGPLAQGKTTLSIVKNGPNEL